MANVRADDHSRRDARDMVTAAESIVADGRNGVADGGSHAPRVSTSLLIGMRAMVDRDRGDEGI